MTGNEHNTDGNTAGLLNSFLDKVQFFALCIIALAAVCAFGMELKRIILEGGAQLHDLLLLFLYTEILIMIRASIHSQHELAITMPISIAVVALGRYMIMGTDHNPLHQLMYAGAIFILVSALFLWSIRGYFCRKHG